jgi:hypothetical protein
MWILLRIVPRSKEWILRRKILVKNHQITHFLPELATNDDKLVGREAIDGENKINEGNYNYDDHNGDDGKIIVNHFNLIEIIKIMKKSTMISKTMKNQIK